MTILRGPAHADHYRVKIGRYRARWYVDPLPTDGIAGATDQAWPSVSAIKSADSKDWTFVGLKRVAQELEDNPRALDKLNYDDRYERLKAINKSGLRQAQDRGTQVHTYFENGLNGKALDVTPFDNPEGATYINAVRAFFDHHQPELVATELVCINRTLNGVGYGGTADALIRIDGKVYLPDWKSRGADSGHDAYPVEAAQVAAYARADYYIGEGPTRRPLPHIDGGLIVSVRPDGYRAYPIDLDKAGQQWERLHAWYTARLTEHDAIGKPWAPRAHTDPLPAAIAATDSAEELRALWAANVNRWTEQHTAAAKARIHVLAATAT